MSLTGHPRFARLKAVRPVLLLAMALFAACSLVPRSAEAPRAPPDTAADAEERTPRLDAAVGAIVQREVGAGERDVFPIQLEEGTYFEVHVDRSGHELEVHLFEPGVDPLADAGEAAYASGVRSPRHGGQLLWQVSRSAGEHHVRVDGRVRPTRYRLEILTLRPAGESDWGLHRGLAIWDQAEALVRHHRFEDAREKFVEARELFIEGGYHVGAGTGFRQEGRMYSALGELDRARTAYLAAAEYGSRHGDLISEILSWTILAGLELSAGDRERARQHLGTARERARDENDPRAEAAVLDHYCYFYKEQGSWDLAVESCQEALRIRRKLGLYQATANPLVLLGRLYSDQGDLEASRRYYQEAAQVFELFPDPDREAVLHNDLAILSIAEGKYLEATVSYQRALEAYESQGAIPEAATVLFNMGTAYEELGQTEKTLELYREALRRMKLVGDVKGRILVLDGMAWLLREMGDLPGAQRLLEEILELGETAISQPQRASFLHRRGEVQLDLGEPAAALASLEESKELYEETGQRWRVRPVLRKIARALEGLGHDERAREVLRQAIVESERVGDPTETADCYYRIARIERRLGNLEEAREMVRRALALVDQVRSSAGSEEIQALYFATVRPYHELLVELIMEGHRREPNGDHAVTAFRESERRRAQSLRQIIAEAGLGLDLEVPEELRELYETYRREVEEIETERQRLLNREESSEAALFEARRDLDHAMTKLQEIELRIRESSPRYAALTASEPITVEDVQSSLLDRQTALLEYSLGEERSYLWLITDTSFHTYELPGREAIESKARCIHLLITAYGEPPAPEDLDPELSSCLGPRLEPYRRIPVEGSPIRVRGRRRHEIELVYERVAAELAEALLGPAARDGLLPLRLAVVSGGALEYVPFAALPSPVDPADPSGGPRLLVDDHELVRLPSASVLSAHRRQRSGPSALPPGLLAIVADPIYGPDDSRVERSEASGDPPEPFSVRSEGTFRRLDLSGEEARRIASLVPAGRRLVIQGLEATRERVARGDLGDYLYVHFATHGQIDTQYPKLSSLVLSRVDETGRVVDSGHLRLHDIYSLDLDDVDMVVLSACETALGREVRGEGLMGLTRGFLYAGADRVAATLWQVQDVMTAELMTRFYSGLFEEDRAPADALRRAQLAARDADGGAHSFPYYWAGFVLQGEWR